MSKDQILEQKCVLYYEEDDQLLQKRRKHTLENLTLERAKFIIQNFLSPLLPGVSSIKYHIDDIKGKNLYFSEIR